MFATHKLEVCGAKAKETAGIRAREHAAELYFAVSECNTFLLHTDNICIAADTGMRQCATAFISKCG